MTNNLKQVLDLLADEVDPTPVDLRDIMATARARTRSQRASLATALATVAVVVAITVTVGGRDSSDGVATPPTSATPTAKDDPPGPRYPPQDEISRRLNTQLQEALDDGLLPSQYTLEADPSYPTNGVLDFRRQDNLNGHRAYTATALMRSTDGVAGLQIFVMKNPAGTELSHFDGQVFGPCLTPGVDNCEHRTLDGETMATAQANARPPALQLSSTMSAQRSDGTYIQVIASVADIYGPSRMAIPPFRNDELFTFATAFDWDSSSDAGATGTAKYDQQLTAAGGLPSRYTITGSGENGDLTKFNVAPDGSNTPRYFMQLTLHRGGESTTFSLFVSRGDAGGDCADGVAGCKEHQLEDGTKASVLLTEDADGQTARLSALRPDNTLIEVDHLGEKGADVMTSDELLKLATAFSY